MRDALSLSTLKEKLSGTPRDRTSADAEVLKSTLGYANDRLLPALRNAEVSWESFLTFWPPRMLQALTENRLICFFGAGLSFPSGLPAWSEMLRSYFGLDQAVLSDDDLKSDPLTQAELASHRLGADKVQTLLRDKLGMDYPPSTGHDLMAALRLPFYITTNYDTLFEKAWKKLNPRAKMEVMTSDLDISPVWPDQVPFPSADCSYLFKIHGCLDKENEHLILTRSDYRRHYRSNDKFFSVVRYLLANYHVLFLGFSHKDPEVTRLVEDAIWHFEKSEEERKEDPAADGQSEILKRPHFYSLQFSMQSHTPEIFAARGIVALHPPLADPAVKDVRSSSLTRALADLIGSAEAGLAARISLDPFLNKFCETVTSDLKSGLALLDRYEAQATERLASREGSSVWMQDLLAELGALAGQGLYLLNDEGKIVNACVPECLRNEGRRDGPKDGFGKRPYFQQAKTYRKPFVSDFFPSIYNDQLTFALCRPIIDDKGFAGLLFAACQPGAWVTPIRVAREIREARPGLSILLVDANGVAMIPPNEEFEAKAVEKVREFGEEPDDNVGFSYRNLLALSRCNKLIERIMENVIPLRQDDDILSLGTDLRQYTVVTEIPWGRWKIGISDSVFLSGKL